MLSWIHQLKYYEKLYMTHLMPFWNQDFVFLKFEFEDMWFFRPWIRGLSWFFVYLKTENDYMAILGHVIEPVVMRAKLNGWIGIAAATVCTKLVLPAWDNTFNLRWLCNFFRQYPILDILKRFTPRSRNTRRKTSKVVCLRRQFFEIHFFHDLQYRLLSADLENYHYNGLTT